jgi:hypothetical protein
MKRPPPTPRPAETRPPQVCFSIYLLIHQSISENCAPSTPLQPQKFDFWYHLVRFGSVWSHLPHLPALSRPSLVPQLPARRNLAEEGQLFPIRSSYSGFKCLPSSLLQTPRRKNAKITILAPEPHFTPRNPPQVLGSTQKYSPVPRSALCAKPHLTINHQPSTINSSELSTLDSQLRSTLNPETPRRTSRTGPFATRSSSSPTPRTSGRVGSSSGPRSSTMSRQFRVPGRSSRTSPRRRPRPAARNRRCC